MPPNSTPGQLFLDSSEQSCFSLLRKFAEENNIWIKIRAEFAEEELCRHTFLNQTSTPEQVTNRSPEPKQSS